MSYITDILQNIKSKLSSVGATVQNEGNYLSNKITGSPAWQLISQAQQYKPQPFLDNAYKQLQSVISSQVGPDSPAARLNQFYIDNVARPLAIGVPQVHQAINAGLDVGRGFIGEQSAGVARVGGQNFNARPETVYTPQNNPQRVGQWLNTLGTDITSQQNMGIIGAMEGGMKSFGGWAGPKVTSLLNRIPEEKILPKVEQYIQPQIERMAQKEIPAMEKVVAKMKPADQDLILKLRNALKEAEPLRGTQEELYSKARSQNLAKMMSAREKMAGEKGFIQELGANTGQLPKVNFEPIRNQFNQESVDRLFNMVKESPHLDEWEKLNAQVGLSKILGPKGVGVPTVGEIEKLYQVYGKDFTETLLSKRTTFEKLGEVAMQAYNLPRSFMAGIGDFSGTLMQNGLFAYRHPILTAKNFVDQLKFFASEDAYRLSGEEIGKRATYDLMKQAKLSLTDTGPFVAQREEQFMASLAEKIPGVGRLVKATGRAYTGFLNKMRADVFDQMINSYKATGGELTGDYLRSVGEFINTATGRGTLGAAEKAMPIIGQGLFSARKLVATAQTLNPFWYVKLHPAVRQEALKTMLSFLGGAATITGLADLIPGVEVGKDSTSADFGKIKVGNTRFNLFGPYQQIAVLMSRMVTGFATSSTTGKKLMIGDENNPFAPNRWDLATRFLEAKEHPTLSYIVGLIRGENNIGQKFDIPKETLQRFVPMVLGDAIELYKEHGPVGLLGLIPAVLGIGTQTYKYELSAKEKEKVAGFSPAQQEAYRVQKLTQAQQAADVSNAKLAQTDRGFLGMFPPKEASVSSVAGYFGKDFQDAVAMPSTNPYQATLKSEKSYALVSKIVADTTLNDEQKNQAMTELGIDPNDGRYYTYAKQSQPARTALVSELIKRTPPAQVTSMLVGLRRSVNGEQILSGPVISDLKDLGLLSAAQATTLKNIDIVNGKAVLKSGGGGSKARPPSYNPPTLKSYTLPRAPNINMSGRLRLRNPSDLKIQQINLPRVSMPNYQPTQTDPFANVRISGAKTFTKPWR